MLLLAEVHKFRTGKTRGMQGKSGLYQSSDCEALRSARQLLTGASEKLGALAAAAARRRAGVGREVWLPCCIWLLCCAICVFSRSLFRPVLCCSRCGHCPPLCLHFTTCFPTGWSRDVRHVLAYFLSITRHGCCFTERPFYKTF